MPYIGNNLATQFQAFATQTITGDGSTGYTLDRAVANGKELLVYINNVKQEEGSGKSYTATGTTITFSAAVASGDSCYLVYMGSAQQTVTAPDGSVGSSQISSADLVLPKTVTIGSAVAEDTKLVFDGNAQDFHIGLDDSADDLVIGKGSAVGTTPALSITEDLLVTTHAGITMAGTTPTLTIGDAGAEDTKIVFDGNAADFHIGLDDSADNIKIGLGSALGTTPILTIADGSLLLSGTTPTLTIGDAGAEDTKIVFDGNAQDFYIGLDDSADDLVIGKGSALGTTPAISIDENLKTQFGGGAVGKTSTANATGSTTLDYDANSNFVLTATGNVTLANPTTETVGQTGIIVFIQDGTGSRTLSTGTQYEWPAGTAGTISTAANSVDVIPYVVDAADSILLGAPQLAFATPS